MNGSLKHIVGGFLIIAGAVLLCNIMWGDTMTWLNFIAKDGVQGILGGCIAFCGICVFFG